MNSPVCVKVSLDKKDIERIRKLNKTVKDLGVYSIEEFDRSIIFYTSEDTDKDNETEVGCVCRVVTSDNVYWTGEVKGTSIQVVSHSIPLSEIL
jgi:hypothetical protein